MKKQTAQEIQIVLTALFIVFICEACAIWLRPFLSQISTIALIRSAQILFLILFFMLSPDRLIFVGLSQANFYQGFKTGLIWSAAFGFVALITGIFIFLTGTNPFKLFHVNILNGNLIIFFLIFNIIGPIAEEIFFRGIIYSFLRRFSIIAALILSTIIFAFLHFSNEGFPLFKIVGGFFFALSFEYSKSLITPVVIHILGNCAIFLISILV